MSATIYLHWTATPYNGVRSCQERARDVLWDRTLFSLTPEQTKDLLADVEDPRAVAQDQVSIERMLAMPQPCHAPSSAPPPAASAGRFRLRQRRLLPLARISSLANQCLDVDAAALRASGLMATEPPGRGWVGS